MDFSWLYNDLFGGVYGLVSSLLSTIFGTLGNAFQSIADALGV